MELQLNGIIASKLARRPGREISPSALASRFYRLCSTSDALGSVCPFRLNAALRRWNAESGTTSDNFVRDEESTVITQEMALNTTINAQKESI